MLHDVCLMNSGDLLTAMLHGVVEGIAHDILGAGYADRLNGNTGVGTDRASAGLLHHVDEMRSGLRALFELNAGIQVLGVLANDDQVDVVIASASTRNRDNGTQAHIQIEALTKGNVHAAEASSHRSGNRALNGNLVALYGFDGALGKRGSLGFHKMSASLGNLPVDVGASCSKHALHGGSGLVSDAVTGNEGHSMLCQ